MANTFVPEPNEVRVRAVTSLNGGVTVDLVSCRGAVACPRCGMAGDRVHSRYQRRLQDLSWSGVPVALELSVRRFSCDRRECPQRVFAERLAVTAPRYGRRSARAQNMLGWLGVALGGEGGARAAARLGVGASGDTILRALRRMSVPPQPPPGMVGIDDWAWRRGQRYGTILVDLESRRPVELLLDRNAETSAEWLRAQPQMAAARRRPEQSGRTLPGSEATALSDHRERPESGVEYPLQVVSRDRAQVYADAARRGAPQAEQVADRFHLLRNLREALEEVTRAVRLPSEAQTTEAGPALAPPPAEPLPAGAPTPGRQRRQQRYERVLDLLRQGRPRRRIAAELGLDVRTVRRWLRAGGFPERAGVRRASRLDAWTEAVKARARSDGPGASQLWQELHAQGSPAAPATSGAGSPGAIPSSAGGPARRPRRAPTTPIRVC